MMYLLRCAQSLLLFILCVGVSGLDTWGIDATTFSRVIWASSLKIGNHLYIDGGYYTTLINGEYSGIEVLNDTLSIDLSKSWDISDVVVSSFPHPTEYYGTRVGAFWWDPITQTALTYGGEFFDEVVDLSTFYVWELTPDGAGGGEWSVRGTSNDNSWHQLYPGAYASITQSNTTAYALGGFNNYAPGNYPFIPGLMAYDLEEKSWTNISTVGEFYSEGAVAHGAAHFVPGVGTAGLLVFIGGSIEPLSNNQPAASSNITIFDPATGEWHSQLATGTPVPSNRLDLCLVGAQETGAGSYEIYLWGGRGGGIADYSTNLDDSNSMYILTLPAFHWIRADAKATNYRSGPTCQVSGNQLISVGGWDSSQSPSKDPWTYSVGIFDMTELQWKDSFNHTAAAYARPEAVNSYYESNAVNPTWGSSALQVAFASLDGSAPSPQNASSTAPAGPSATSNAPSSSSSGSKGGGSSTNVGAIAGGAVGGIAVVGIIALTIAWFLIRRRRERRRQKQFARPGEARDDKLGVSPGLSSVTSPLMGQGGSPQPPRQSGPWEMGGQYDRPEISTTSYHPHELDATHGHRQA